MKCKACNGTGYVTACVYESDEIGFVDKNYECAVCHGTGLIEQTNEEWFCKLNTRLKAEAIFVFMDNVAKQISGEPITNKEEIINDVIMRWLKDKHEEEENTPKK